MRANLRRLIVKAHGALMLVSTRESKILRTATPWCGLASFIPDRNAPDWRSRQSAPNGLVMPQFKSEYANQ